jgi:hypothetical protein
MVAKVRIIGAALGSHVEREIGGGPLYESGGQGEVGHAFHRSHLPIEVEPRKCRDPGETEPDDDAIAKQQSRNAVRVLVRV